MNSNLAPKIDATQLEAIASGIPDVVMGILADFRDSFGEEINKLVSSWSEVSAEKWLEFFHRIKGSGGTLLSLIHI